MTGSERQGKWLQAAAVCLPPRDPRNGHLVSCHSALQAKPGLSVGIRAPMCLTACRRYKLSLCAGTQGNSCWWQPFLLVWTTLSVSCSQMVRGTQARCCMHTLCMVSVPRCSLSAYTPQIRPHSLPFHPTHGFAPSHSH